MNQKRMTKLLAGLVAATALVAPLAAQAADRVEQDITRERGTSNGISGYWVTVKERTYRYDPQFSQRIAQVFPGGTGLSSTENDLIVSMLTNLGLTLTNAQIQAAVNAFKNWKASAPGYGTYHGWGGYSSVQSSYASTLSSQLAGAMGIPNNSTLYNAAYSLAARVASDRSWSYDPLVFDLNGDGKINVTGLSSAKSRVAKNGKFVAEGSVMFDIRGKGKPDRVEWVTGGDGILVDNRKDVAKNLVAQGKPLSIYNLFGDTEGNPGGFHKLARLFDAEAMVASRGNIKADGLGTIKGKELDDLLMWVDNGDGKAEPSELHTLASLGITEIRLPNRHLINADGELIEEATFIRNDKPFKIQEVWFMGESDNAK